MQACGAEIRRQFDEVGAACSILKSLGSRTGTLAQSRANRRVGGFFLNHEDRGVARATGSIRGPRGPAEADARDAVSETGL